MTETEVQAISDKEEEKSATESIIGPDLNCSRAPVDKKLYRQIMLKNGLRALLISDTFASKTNFEPQEAKSISDSSSFSSSENENKDNMEEEDDRTEDASEEGPCMGERNAAAGLLVGAGSYYENGQAKGTAHFLEHMLFMGNEKNPSENAYSSFISDYGGSENAYTENEYTVYYFDIIQEKLFEALDMLAHFFVSPLLRADAVERELSAVESEFQLRVNSDGSRLREVQRCAAKPTHPFFQFSHGNRYTLKELPESQGIDILAILRNFFDEFYYAANMRLVVIGAFTLDELQEQVEKSCSLIPAQPRIKTTSTKVTAVPKSWEDECISPLSEIGLPFPHSSLCKINKIVPVRDVHVLNLTWQIPSQKKNWRTKPCDILAHLFGHESTGSLLSALKERRWGISCSAGISNDGDEAASSHALFSINLGLSKDAVHLWPNITELIFYYVGMIKHYCSQSEGLPLYIFTELKTINELSYRFANEMSPDDLVDQIIVDFAPCSTLPPDRLLDGSSLLFEFDNNVVKNLVEDYFTVENCRIDLISSLFGRSSEITKQNSAESKTHGDDVLDLLPKYAPMTEQYFGAKYWCDEITADILDRWQTACSASLPPTSTGLALPPVNPFVPTDFGLRDLPLDDFSHFLLNRMIKLTMTDDQNVESFQANVIRFNARNNKLLLLNENTNEEKWYLADFSSSEEDILTLSTLTCENKSISLEIVENSSNENNEEIQSDSLVQYPPIPQPTISSHLPQIVYNNEVLKLWHMQDRKFKRPFAYLRLYMIAPTINSSPLHRACGELLTMLVVDAITETSYLADLCELQTSINTADAGFTMHFYGFNDKLLELMDSVLSVFLSICADGENSKSPFKEGRFEACHEILLRNYENSGLRAAAYCKDIRLRCLMSSLFSAGSKRQAVHQLTKSVFTETVLDIFSKMFAECFFYGNCNEDDARNVGDKVNEYLKDAKTSALQSVEASYSKILKLPATKKKEFISVRAKDPNEPNTVVEVYHQIGKDETEDRITIDLLVQLISEPFFDQLRTKEEFGYSVHCMSKWTFGVMGISFMVISSSKTSDEISARIQKFLVEFRDSLVELSDESFRKNQVGLAKCKLSMFSSMEEESSHFWSEITERRYAWEYLRNEVVHLQSLTKEKLVEKYDEWLNPSFSHRCFEIHVNANTNKELENQTSEIMDEEVDNLILSRYDSSRAHW